MQGRYDDIDPVGLYPHARPRAARHDAPGSRRSSTSGAVYVAERHAMDAVVAHDRRTARRPLLASTSRDQRSGEWGTVTKGILSPKLSMIFGPWQDGVFRERRLRLSLNDARGATITRDPSTGEPADPVTPLARAKSAELGVRSLPLPRCRRRSRSGGSTSTRSSCSWATRGRPRRRRPSQRYGVEWANYYRVLSWLPLDADLSFSRARFTRRRPGRQPVPGAVQNVFSGGFSVDSLGGWFGSLRCATSARAPLIEDGSVKSNASTTVNALLGYELIRGLRAQVDVSTCSTRRPSTSTTTTRHACPAKRRAAVEDVHSHPATPRSARVALVYGF